MVRLESKRKTQHNMFDCIRRAHKLLHVGERSRESNKSNWKQKKFIHWETRRGKLLWSLGRNQGGTFRRHIGEILPIHRFKCRS